MTARYIPTKDTERQKKLKWTNGIVTLHDIYCDCCNPITHTIVELFAREPVQQFSAPEKQLIEKCLSGEDRTAITHEEDIVGEGDLDALFEGPFEEDHTG